MENSEVPAEVAVSIAEAAGNTRIDITEDLPSAADDNIFVNTGRPKTGTNKHDKAWVLHSCLHCHCCWWAVCER